MPAIVHRLVRIALIGLMVTTVSACLISIGGCSSAEAAAFNEVGHYGAAELVPEDDGLGGCGASFSTGDDPNLVIEHYRSTLEAAGWTIDPPLPSPLPPPEDGIGLGARKGTLGFGVSAEMVGEPETIFVIHVNEVAKSELLAPNARASAGHGRAGSTVAAVSASAGVIAKRASR